jgi:hypothetical protein
MKLTVEIELLSDGRCNLDVYAVEGSDGKPAYRVYGHWERIWRKEAEARLRMAMEVAMDNLEGDEGEGGGDRDEGDWSEVDRRLGEYEEGSGTPDHRYKGGL